MSNAIGQYDEEYKLNILFRIEMTSTRAVLTNNSRNLSLPIFNSIFFQLWLPVINFPLFHITKEVYASWISERITSHHANLNQKSCFH